MVERKESTRERYVSVSLLRALMLLVVSYGFHVLLLLSERNAYTVELIV